jgi:prolyl-tRNA synthetase
LEPNVSEQAAEALYKELVSSGLQPLYDDRTESPGVKFNDADLIGMPLRITVGDRALQQGGVELKRRDGEEKEIVPFNQVIDRLREEMSRMQREIDQRVKPVEFK